MLYFIFLSCPIKVVTNCKHQVAGQYVCIAFNAPGSGYFTAIGIGLRQKVVRFEMNTEVVIYISDVTAVPLKWASRSSKQLKHSLLEEVFHVRRFESVILQPINGLLYEQKQICVRTIG